MRRVAATLAVLAAAVAWLGLLLAPADAATGPGRGRVVVVAAVPDLRWSDVGSMPQLRALAARGAVGLLSDKTVGTSTGCLTGLLAIGAGTRTSGPPPGGPATCREQGGAVVAANRSNAYRADPYALGDALRAAGVTVVGADRLAAAAVGGGAARRALGWSAAVREAGRAGGRSLVVSVNPALLQTTRRQARASVDAWLGRVSAALPPGGLLIVVGSADSRGAEAHLHVAVLTGPGIAHRALTSASTGRAPYVQLVDVAPTVLHAFGLAVPGGMIGLPMTVSGSAAPTVRQAADADRHARAAVPAAEALRSLLITLASVALALALLGVWVPRLRPAAVILARWAAPMPLLCWLLQLIPWWRAGTAWAVAAVVVLSLAEATVMTLLRAGGLDCRIELLALPGATALLLAVDQLTGGGLQISAPLGDNPLEAGRFTGIGNADFAVLMGSALLVAATAAGMLMAAGRSRSIALTVATVVLLSAIIVDGAPQLGDDLGGVLSAVPAAAVTLALLAGWGITRGRALAIVGGAVGLAAVAALADYARPAAHQTHLGHFVGQLLHGGSGTTLHRKLVGTLRLQGEIPLVLAVVALLVPRRWWEPARDWLRRTPGLAAAVAGLAVLMVLGSLLNDSGVAVLGFVLAATAPSIVAATVPPGGALSPGQAGATADLAPGVVAGGSRP